jgi:DNA primase
MLKPILTPRDIAERYNRFMPDEVRQFLKDRGVAATVIDRELLGFDGKRIVIPVFGETTREVLGFRYAAIPKDPWDEPNITSDRDSEPLLYGRETLARKPHRVVICEGAFDRLVLESRGFPAVAPTGGAGVFLPEWAKFFEGIDDVSICFRRGAARERAARDVQKIIPGVRIAKLPADVGEGGSISDFFERHLRSMRDFEIVLAGGVSSVQSGSDAPQVKLLRPANKAHERWAEKLRKSVRLHDVVFEFANLQASGGRLVGHCPFHDDGSRSFSVYPETDTYCCSVCGAAGDVVAFLMNKESLTFGQALEALERYRYTHEL